jgi:hypothetical protein
LKSDQNVVEVCNRITLLILLLLLLLIYSFFFPGKCRRSFMEGSHQAVSCRGDKRLDTAQAKRSYWVRSETVITDSKYVPAFSYGTQLALCRTWFLTVSENQSLSKKNAVVL